MRLIVSCQGGAAAHSFLKGGKHAGQLHETETEINFILPAAHPPGQPCPQHLRCWPTMESGNGPNCYCMLSYENITSEICRRIERKHSCGLLAHEHPRDEEPLSLSAAWQTCLHWRTSIAPTLRRLAIKIKREIHSSEKQRTILLDVTMDATNTRLQIVRMTYCIRAERPPMRWMRSETQLHMLDLHMATSQMILPIYWMRTLPGLAKWKKDCCRWSPGLELVSFSCPSSYFLFCGAPIENSS